MASRTPTDFADVPYDVLELVAAQLGPADICRFRQTAREYREIGVEAFWSFRKLRRRDFWKIFSRACPKAFQAALLSKLAEDPAAAQKVCKWLDLVAFRDEFDASPAYLPNRDGFVAWVAGRMCIIAVERPAVFWFLARRGDMRHFAAALAGAVRSLSAPGGSVAKTCAVFDLVAGRGVDLRVFVEKAASDALSKDIPEDMQRELLCEISSRLPALVVTAVSSISRIAWMRPAVARFIACRGLCRHFDDLAETLVCSANTTMSLAEVREIFGILRRRQWRVDQRAYACAFRYGRKDVIEILLEFWPDGCCSAAGFFQLWLAPLVLDDDKDILVSAAVFPETSLLELIMGGVRAREPQRYAKLLCEFFLEAAANGRGDIVEWCADTCAALLNTSPAPYRWYSRDSFGAIQGLQNLGRDELVSFLRTAACLQQPLRFDLLGKIPLTLFAELAHRFADDDAPVAFRELIAQAQARISAEEVSSDEMSRVFFEAACIKKDASLIKLCREAFGAPPPAIVPDLLHSAFLADNILGARELYVSAGRSAEMLAAVVCKIQWNMREKSAAMLEMFLQETAESDYEVLRRAFLRTANSLYTSVVHRWDCDVYEVLFRYRIYESREKILQKATFSGSVALLELLGRPSFGCDSASPQDFFRSSAPALIPAAFSSNHVEMLEFLRDCGAPAALFTDEITKLFKNPDWPWLILREYLGPRLLRFSAAYYDISPHLIAVGCVPALNWAEFSTNDMLDLYLDFAPESIDADALSYIMQKGGLCARLIVNEAWCARNKETVMKYVAKADPAVLGIFARRWPAAVDAALQAAGRVVVGPGRLRGGNLAAYFAHKPARFLEIVERGASLEIVLAAGFTAADDPAAVVARTLARDRNVCMLDILWRAGFPVEYFAKAAAAFSAIPNGNKSREYLEAYVASVL